MQIVEQYVGSEKMFRRVGTCHVYRINDATREAVCQLNWAYGKLAEPCVTFSNGRTSHECANEVIELHEDALLDHLRIAA